MEIKASLINPGILAIIGIHAEDIDGLEDAGKIIKLNDSENK